MKKRLAALALIAPIACLCACSGASALSLGANWYRQTDTTTGISGTSENLEYSVTFTSAGNDAFYVTYDEGTYETALTSETVTLSDGTSEMGYRYYTEYAISGRYTVNGETGETFYDSITSEVIFRNVAEGLQPIRSLKTVKSTSPVSISPKTLEEAYRVYEYTYEVTYDNPISEAQIVYTRTLPSEKVTEKTVAIKTKGSYLDNEQILFALRGLDMSASASFVSINPLDMQTSTVAITSPTATSETLTLNLNGETSLHTIDAYSVSLAYSGGTFTGQPQTLVYAKKQDVNDNTYRNVLIRMSVPVLQSLGTLNYTLIKAEFNGK